MTRQSPSLVLLRILSVKSPGLCLADGKKVGAGIWPSKRPLRVERRPYRGSGILLRSQLSNRGNHFRSSRTRMRPLSLCVGRPPSPEVAATIGRIEGGLRFVDDCQSTAGGDEVLLRPFHLCHTTSIRSRNDSPKPLNIDFVPQAKKIEGWPQARTGPPGRTIARYLQSSRCDVQ